MSFKRAVTIVLVCLYLLIVSAGNAHADAPAVLPVWQSGLARPWVPLYQVPDAMELWAMLDYWPAGYYFGTYGDYYNDARQEYDTCLVGMEYYSSDVLLYARFPSEVVAWCDAHDDPDNANWRHYVLPVGICGQ